MKRQVTFTEGDTGIFQIACAECPLLPSLTELGMEPRACINGIMTNMQGAVQLGQCEHYKQNSIQVGDDDNGLIITCMKGDKP